MRDGWLSGLLDNDSDSEEGGGTLHPGAQSLFVRSHLILTSLFSLKTATYLDTFPATGNTANGGGVVEPGYSGMAAAFSRDYSQDLLPLLATFRPGFAVGVDEEEVVCAVVAVLMELTPVLPPGMSRELVDVLVALVK